jgi:multidrug efflux pump subunit AcrA (membrane-fusion protein)
LVPVLVVLSAAAAWWLFRARPQAPGTVAMVRTAKVTRGPIERRLRVGGSTSARNFALIGAPRLSGPDIRELNLMKLAKPGSWVKKGEVVAQIDAQAARDHVDDVDSQVQQAESDIKKRIAEQAIELENLRQSLRAAKAEVDKSQLDSRTAEIRTPIDVELLKLEVEEAEAQYKQLQSDMPDTLARHKAEIRILELTRDRHARHRDRHASDIVKLTIRASIGGLLVMQSSFVGGEMRQIQEGDQMRPGQPFARIVDISTMQLDAAVNQVEAEQLRIGQTVNVEFDAFPGLRLPGTVYALGAMAVSSWRQNDFIRNIPVKIRIEGEDPRVIPDLSASGDILIAREENALLVPLAAVAEEGRKATVRVRGPNGFQPHEVQLGLRSNTHAAVLSGLEEGQEVLLGFL